jgi:hypothetical protein
MKQMNKLFLLVFCACFFSIQINAQSEKVAEGGADLRVAKALNQTKTEYEVRETGMYKVTFMTNGKRTQSALINSETVKIYGLEMRLIFSFAQVYGNFPAPAVNQLLLQENLDNFPNVWAIQKDKKGKFSILNQIYIPADSSGEALDMAVSSVMLAADKLEQRLTKEDKY